MRTSGGRDGAQVTGHALPEPRHDWALFLDFDGTLTELAPHPDAVRIDPALPALLETIFSELDGALAVVSGRRLAELDRHLRVRLPAAGVHGLELRERPGAIVHPPAEALLIARLKARLAGFVAADDRLLLEEKPGALALHFRQAPDKAAECVRLMEEATADLEGIHVLKGKMVLEAKPARVNKGHAIETMMKEPPFIGRVPVFAGDDTTDEDGFRIVNALGGISIKIADGDTLARYRMDDVQGFINWLKHVASVLSP